MLEWCIEPIYRTISPSLKFKDKAKTKIKTFPINHNVPEFSICQVEDEKRLFQELPKILKILGLGISHSPLLFTKVLRLLRYVLKQQSCPEEYKEMTMHLAKFVFLPALA